MTAVTVQKPGTSKASNSHSSTISPSCQLFPNNPRKAMASVFVFYARENLKSSILQAPMLSVTCSSGEHVDRGAGWAPRSSWNSLRNFRKSCWRWRGRFTLQREQDNPITSLTGSFKPNICVTSFLYLLQST